MYEELTPEYIKSDMLGEFKIADVREGSYTNTLVSPVALELWKAYRALDAIIPMIYVDETSGIYADKRANEYGIYRKAGTKATAVVEFTGVDGTVIKAGKVFMTDDSLEFVLEDDCIIENGTAQGILIAVEIGAKYNVPAGAIYRQTVNQIGIDGVNSFAAEGGTDEESTASLVDRFYAFLKRPPTSGNVAHYEHWAREVPGVDAVKVFPLWLGAGSVKVLIAGPGGAAVDQTIVDNTFNYIETVRPIGAMVTVKSVVPHPINVEASVQLTEDVTLPYIQEAFEAALTEYLRSIALKSYTVIYNRIAYTLLSIPGVINFTSLLVNGGTADAVIDEEEVPMTGSVEVTT